MILTATSYSLVAGENNGHCCPVLSLHERVWGTVTALASYYISESSSRTFVLES